MKGRLAEMFQRRGNDLSFLNALNEELKQRNSDAANDLHVRVVMARRALVRAQPSTGSLRAAPPSEPVHDWLCGFLGARKLARPDGRPIYRYRMEDSEYEQAKRSCGAWRPPVVSPTQITAPARCSSRIARNGSAVSRPQRSFVGYPP